MSKIRSTSDRRRRVLLAAVAMMIIIIGAVATSTANIEIGHPRAVDLVRTVGFSVLALVIAIRSTTSFSFLKRDPTLDDELTRANRASAARVGFWALMLGVLAAFAGAFYTPLPLLAIAPLLLALGAGAASIRFAMLEARGDEGA